MKNITVKLPKLPSQKQQSNMKIFLHLPAYREPELIPTIKDALNNADNPDRLVFGICRQYNPEDTFDNVDEFRNDKRFKIFDLHYTEAKGLPYARAIINEKLLTDEDFVLQLDSHHRFTKGWDTFLVEWYFKLKLEGYNPILTGYLPLYSPFNDPEGRVQEPWQQEAASFYPHGTIFIRPVGIPDWEKLQKPFPSRFMSGHFSFGPNQWAKEIKHDPDIYFSGEELNLTIRTFTHGYDLFHPHRVVIWHATMREERSGMLVWDDQHKRGDDMWWRQQDIGRAKIRQLLRTEDNGYDLTGYDIGDKRTIRDYEMYAGIHFKRKSFQKYTKENKFPPNPKYDRIEDWENSFMYSFYHLVNIDRGQLPADDYSSILVAFDDENGLSLNSKSITGRDLELFLKEGRAIHYEEMFMTDKKPSRVVYWGYSTTRGWAERIENKIN